MKTRRNKAAAVAVLITGIAAAAPAMAAGEWYAGGALGQAYIDENIDGVEIDADSTAFRVFGGYAFSDYFALEASYLDFGTFKDTVDVSGVPVDVSATTDGFSLAVLGSLPMSERLSLRGKAGVFFSDGRSTVAGVRENDPSDESAFVGAGLGYDLSERAGVFLDVEYYDLDDAEPLLASLGFAFRF